MNTQSIWLATTPQTHFKTLDRNIHVDVAIVGGGIAGITAAVLLKKAGKTVAVLEKNHIVTGETGFTTAHITDIFDARYQDLASNFGEHKTRLAAESVRSARRQIEQLIVEFGIACDFQQLAGYLYCDREHEDFDFLRKEVAAARNAGLAVEIVPDAPLPFRTGAALRFEDQAQFHPRRYLLPLAKWVDGDGSYVFEQTSATEFDDDTPCRVKTSGGIVTARDVIVTAFSPVCNWAFLHTKLPAYRTYAIGAKLKDNGAVSGLFYDTLEPYHYIRSQPDGKGGQILIVGGEDHKTGKVENTEECFERLEEYTREYFDVESIAYRWSGQILEPLDGLAYIGKNSMSNHIYVATGFSGTGMTFGTLSGMILSDLIVRGQNRWAELYDATRIHPLASAGEFFSENIDFPTHFIGDRFAKFAESIDDVLPGEGKWVKVNGEKVAVSRDMDGTLHGCSIECSHMGCYVHWNSAEKTWDCPCHGSRFDPDGKVVTGPAITDLKKVELPQAVHH